MQEVMPEVETKVTNSFQSVTDENVQKLDFIEKEVEMGFFDHHSFEVRDGVVVNESCQRISHCSCDCNDCFLEGGI